MTTLTAGQLTPFSLWTVSDHEAAPRDLQRRYRNWLLAQWSKNYDRLEISDFCRDTLDDRLGVQTGCPSIEGESLDSKHQL